MNVYCFHINEKMLMFSNTRLINLIIFLVSTDLLVPYQNEGT